MKTLVNRYDKSSINALPTVQFDGRIVVVQSEGEARKAVDFLLKHRILGMDTETRPVFSKGHGMNPVALLQISTHKVCFLFRLNMIGVTDDILRLLCSTDITIVGLSLKDDFLQLRRRRDFEPAKYVELQTIAKEFGIVDMSLQKLYANLYHRKISKSQQLSNWEAGVLTEPQKRYAATDAWACVQLYDEFMRLDKYGYAIDMLPDPNCIVQNEQIQQNLS